MRSLGWRGPSAAGCVLGLLVLLSSGIALALDVSGPINSTTTWSAAQSPYRVVGSVAVQSGATLVIEPGVTVLMRPGTSLTVSSGALRARGTAALPIVFTAESDTPGGSPVPGSWGVLRFANGTNDSLTLLEHVEVRYGQGVVIESASPTLNHVLLLDNSGPAVTADLASSPAGVGLQATGNGIDGVLVPPGEITGPVVWGLRGIPYVVSQGTVSVGRAPAVVSVAPSQISQGMTVTMTVSGTRLGGVERVRFDNAGLTGTVLPGGSDTSFSVDVTASAQAATGPAALEVRVAAGQARLEGAVTVIPPKPPIAVDGITPGSLRRGESRSFQVTGQHLAGASVTTTAAGLGLGNVSTSTTSMSFTLTASVSAALGAQTLTFTNPASASGSATAVVTVNDLPPTVVTSPAPVAVPPDNVARLIKLRLSRPDGVDHSFAVSISNTNIATVSPANVSIAAGQTEANLLVTGLGVGQTVLTLVSPTLGTVTTPVFVTTEFTGLNTSFALPLGVVVTPPESPPPSSTVSVASGLVGVALGNHLADVSPRVFTIGTGPVPLVISGAGLDSITAVALVPADGVTLGTPAASPDGSQLTVPVTVASDAPLTVRQVVLSGGGRVLAMRPDADRVKIVRPVPIIDWISPLFAQTGSSGVSLTVSGRNFQDLQGVGFVPGDGISVGVPTVSPDGTLITVSFSVAADAPLGPRVVTVSTLGGTSPAIPSAANTLSVVHGTAQDITPVAAAPLGVVLDLASPPTPLSFGVWPSNVGVIFGSALTSLRPVAGVIGSNVTLSIQGAGLGGVTAVQLSPSTGITVGAPQLAPDGNSLTVSLAIAADAPQTTRTVQVLAGSQQLSFMSVEDALFRVTPQPPLIDSISPLVVQTGAAPTTLTLSGANLQNASRVSILPPDGMTLSAPSTNATGTTTTVTIAADAGAATGPRVVTLTTPAGETSRTPGAANTLTVASTAGTSFGLYATSVGVTLEESATPSQVPYGPLLSPAVGVEVTVEAPATGMPLLVPGALVGVALGPTALAVSPAGVLSGQSATVTISGTDLGTVTSVAVVPSTGLTLGTFTASADGTQLTLPVTVDAAAPASARQFVLSRASGPVRFSQPAANRLVVVPALPVLSSIEPILGTQGQAVSLLIRATNLQYASGVTITPSTGVTLSPTFTVDTAQGQLTITFSIAPDAPIGPRVIQVVTPAGSTPAEPSPVNTFTIRSP